MARLTWDSSGSHLYETGLDRGVLYLGNNTGVVWNGLMSVNEEPNSGSSTPLYFDGVKYFDDPAGSDYSATITAYRYPTEFLQFDGYALALNGMYFNNQNRKTFSLSYRTLIGNDTSNTRYGYKIHIVYNLTADPASVNYTTVNDGIELTEFSWKVNSVPETVAGFFPVSHVVIDSTIMTSTALTAIENALYGTASTTATLQTPTDLVTLAFA